MTIAYEPMLMKTSPQIPISREDYAIRVKAANEAFGWRSIPVLLVMLLTCLMVAFSEAFGNWREMTLLGVFALSFAWVLKISFTVFEELGIKCPSCHRFISGHHTARIVMATGECRYCGTEVLIKPAVPSSL